MKLKMLRISFTITEVIDITTITIGGISLYLRKLPHGKTDRQTDEQTIRIYNDFLLILENVKKQKNIIA